MELNFPHRPKRKDATPAKPLQRLDMEVLLSIIGGDVSAETISAFRESSDGVTPSGLEQQIDYFASTRPRGARKPLNTGSFCQSYAEWQRTQARETLSNKTKSNDENAVYQNGLGNFKTPAPIFPNVASDKGQDS